MGSNKVEAGVDQPVALQPVAHGLPGLRRMLVVLRKRAHHVRNHPIDPAGRVDGVAVARAVHDGELDREALVLHSEDHLADLRGPSPQRLPRVGVTRAQLSVRHVRPEEGPREGGLAQPTLAHEHHSEAQAGASPLRLQLRRQAQALHPTELRHAGQVAARRRRGSRARRAGRQKQNKTQ
eukprot:scaffold7258_cov122-Isochrysis_galbana.AAC.11